MSTTRPSINLARLSIFPLPRALLFPHAVLPLHVFEPRYRRLLADCLADDRAMAIACLDEDQSEDGAGWMQRPLVRRLIGVGTVVAHESLDDGRSNLMLRGVGRARIEDEHFPGDDRPYRVVRASWVEDLPLMPARELEARQALAALAGVLAERLPEGGDTLRALIGSQPHAGGLSDLLAAALVVEPGARLRIFETLDVPTRCEGVHKAIAVALRSLGSSDTAPN